MSSRAVLPAVSNASVHAPHNSDSSRPQVRMRRNSLLPLSFRFIAQSHEEPSHIDAEVFYLQKQIQSQTPMVIVLEDGEQIEGCIEWYDRNTLKVRGRAKTLIYKSAIKYMYKLGDPGQ
jgi:sRNA-binding regulator protein Hfq